MHITRRALLSLSLAASATWVTGQEATMNIDADWEYVADRVMGGVSAGALQVDDVGGRRAHRLAGDVSTQNNGGFIQMAFDLGDAEVFDASSWTGIEIDVFGNDEVYDIRLRTDQLTRPWQSFRATFNAPRQWTTVQVPFTSFEANKTDATFDPARLRRIGVLAYGRDFKADVAVSQIRFYR
ncbi:CIA30 family protein [Ascidiaceihabitans donghaensis]|nr:CIA30 family protein [Ascidiaceihabitans donghaensis]